MRQDFDSEMPTLRGLPRLETPERLATQLRITASRECARRIAHKDWRTSIRTWVARTYLWRENLMKPLAIPFAGGLASACILFSALIPTFAQRGGQVRDVTPAWYQTAELSELGPFGLKVDNINLDVTIDEQGRFVDYSVPSSEAGLMKNQLLRREVENNLLFMRFTPANFFGQPTAGTIRIIIRRSQVDVKG